MDFSKLKDLLDSEENWPCDYLFKFIVPAEKLPEVEEILGNINLKKRPSRNGRYVGVTVKMLCHTSDDVISVYKKLSVIKGIINL